MGNNFAKFQAMENAWEKKLRPSVIWVILEGFILI